MTLNLAQTSVAKSRPSVPVRGKFFCGLSVETEDDCWHETMDKVHGGDGGKSRWWMYSCGFFSYPERYVVVFKDLLSVPQGERIFKLAALVLFFGWQEPAVAKDFFDGTHWTWNNLEK